MTHWLRFDHHGKVGFGTLEGTSTVVVHSGTMFDRPQKTGERIDLGAAKLLTPTVPAKFIGLWNNFNALAEKLSLSAPPEPLYFLKGNNSFLAGGEVIRQPQFYDGRVVFEAELGIVIGKRCKDLEAAQAPEYIFGYTCVNDVTAFDVLNKDASFAQWTRAKSFDTFGVFGPVIATDLDPQTLTIRAVLEGDERQNYPVSDMTMAPAKIVSAISKDMTLEPGDIIACGTSVGAGKMKPGSGIVISIEGIGALSNRFEGVSK